MLESDIAIIGMSCRFPGAEDIETFWRNLQAGHEAIRPLREDELAAAGITDEQRKDPSYVAAGSFLEDVELFDADFFGIGREEAELIDPQQRILLECAFEALEKAGYVPETAEGRVGVYAGLGMNSYCLHNLAERFRYASAVGRYQLMLANDKDFAATRVSYRLNLRGPSVGINTACSTSLVALHMACLGLLTGDCDMALVGGAHVAVPQKEGYRYQQGMIFSPDGHCRAFDAKAEGTVIGSGAGVVVLKQLRRAVEDGDWVHAVVKGTAINNDGASKPGYTAPSVGGQAAAIAGAQEAAGCSPDTISYVEAHGTGTPLGDPIEVEALTEAFSRGEGRSEPCALGAVKTNIGHLDVAAGMAGLIKTALMLENRTLVPTLHFAAPNPDIDLSRGPFYVNTERKAWPDGAGPRRAGVSSFGIGGTNAHAVLEEPPAVEPAADTWADRLLVLSARTPAALEKAADRLARHLKAHRALPLGAVAQTLALGRRAHRHRMALVCDDVGDAALALALRDAGRLSQGDAGDDDAAIAFVFADEQADHDHGRAPYDELPAFRAAADRCAAIVDDGRDGAALIAAGGALGAFVSQYAVAEVLKSWSVRPAAVVGSGVGALLAGHVAGALPLAACLERAAGGDAPPVPSGPTELAWLSADSGERVDPAAPVSDGPGAGGEAGNLPPARLTARLEEQGFVPVRLAPDGPSGSGRPFLLALLGRLWTSGAAVDWKAVRAADTVRRAPLPTYPFERSRYWIEPIALPSPSAGAAVAANGADRQTVVQDFVRDEIASVLGIDRGQVNLDTRFFDMGVESLALIQIASKLGDAIGQPVQPSVFVEYPTLRQLARSFEPPTSDPVADDGLDNRVSARARARRRPRAGQEGRDAGALEER